MQPEIIVKRWTCVSPGLCVSLLCAFETRFCANGGALFLSPRAVVFVFLTVPPPENLRIIWIWSRRATSFYFILCGIFFFFPAFFCCCCGFLTARLFFFCYHIYKLLWSRTICDTKNDGRTCFYNIKIINLIFFIFAFYRDIKVWYPLL